MAFFKVALENSIARVNFETHAVWFSRIVANLAAILGPTAPVVEIRPKRPLCVHIIVTVVMLVVIKRSQHLVDVSDSLVAYLSHHVIIVVQSKRMVQGCYVALHSLPHINHDVFFSSKLVFHDYLGLWQVDVEVIKTCLKMVNSFIKCALFMEELHQRVCLHLAYQRLSTAFKNIDFFSHRVLLLEHVLSLSVQCVIEHLED